MSRSWGDGAIDYRTHIIRDIRMIGDRQDQWALCSCGELVEAGDFLTIAHAWAYHTGAEVSIPTLNEQADDEEVHEFLKHIENPDYVSAKATAGQVVHVRERDLDSLHALVERLIDEHDPFDPDCAVCVQLQRYV